MQLLKYYKENRFFTIYPFYKWGKKQNVYSDMHAPKSNSKLEKEFPI
jgi:hypothetical protein